MYLGGAWLQSLKRHGDEGQRKHLGRRETARAERPLRPWAALTIERSEPAAGRLSWRGTSLAIPQGAPSGRDGAPRLPWERE